MALTPEKLIPLLPDFLEKVESLGKLIGVPVADLVADHVAMRVNTNETVDEIKPKWSEKAELISTAEINGRPIMVYRFKKQPKFKKWSIECLELPYPAIGKTYEEGWEHVEFVAPSPSKTTDCDVYVEEMKGMFPKLKQNWDSMKENGVEIKISTPNSKQERLPNFTIAFKKGNVTLKLHPHSLANVIASEEI